MGERIGCSATRLFPVECTNSTTPARTTTEIDIFAVAMRWSDHTTYTYILYIYISPISMRVGAKKVLVALSLSPAIYSYR